MVQFKLIPALALSLFIGMSAAEVAAQCASMRIVNSTPWAIHELFLSPIDEFDWGPDQLGRDTIEPGDAFTLSGIDCDSYDVKLVDEDDDECVVEDVDLCGGGAVWKLTPDALVACQAFGEPPARAGSRARPSATVKIANRSQFQVDELYLSSSDDYAWGPDQLGDDVIGSGESVTLAGVACDTYDIKVVDEDGDVCIIDEVDLCEDDSVWQLTDRELLRCEGYAP